MTHQPQNWWSRYSGYVIAPSVANQPQASRRSGLSAATATAAKQATTTRATSRASGSNAVYSRSVASCGDTVVTRASATFPPSSAQGSRACPSR